MSDNDPGPHSMIYAQVEPERIADVNWIMEGYEHLAMVSTVDGTSGLIKFYATRIRILIHWILLKICRLR